MKRMISNLHSFSRNFKKILRISFFSKAALPITIIPMKKTQKIKHKKHPNSVHLTKKARLIKRRHQIRRQKQFLCFILFLIIILSLSFLILRPLRTSRQTHMINSACEPYRSDVESSCCKIRYVCICRSYSGSYDAGKLRSGNRRYAIL